MYSFAKCFTTTAFSIQGPPPIASPRFSFSHHTSSPSTPDPYHKSSPQQRDPILQLSTTIAHLKTRISLLEETLRLYISISDDQIQILTKNQHLASYDELSSHIESFTTSSITAPTASLVQVHTNTPRNVAPTKHDSRSSNFNRRFHTKLPSPVTPEEPTWPPASSPSLSLHYSPHPWIHIFAM